MRKTIAVALAAAMGITGVIAGAGQTQAAALGVAPAAVERNAERLGNVENVEFRRYGHYRGRGWHGPRRGYYGRHGYGRHYYGRHYYRDRDNGGAAVAAGILGLAAGAIAGSALANRGSNASDWHAYCSSKYRSYDPASGTYLGYDGLRHPCR